MPGSILTQQQLKQGLSDADYIASNRFLILKSLCALNGTADESTAQELLLRALEFRELFSEYEEILDALVREAGLFPYLSPERLGLADRIAYEYHKPSNLEDNGLVFHRPQARVYRELMHGRNVILSAPTSFGKSLIIDAIVASGKYQNILVIVPTIALIDETRRRLATLRPEYKIITHTFQKTADRNIFLLTQERVLERTDLDRVDFFVIDEFYKLSPGKDGAERWPLLNQAFYQLARRGKQFYMLGPNVYGVANDLKRRLEYMFIHEPYNTVASEVHPIHAGNDPFGTLSSLCKTLTGPTLIFCQSPTRASDVARHLIASGVGSERPELQDAANWIGQQYHRDWHFVTALREGVGVHHGRVPRSLAQYVVRSFDAGFIRYLVCTSTLIEGVNTKAQNVIIFDNKINKSKFDYFTFNNIRGRSGRMFQHFVGHVYLFHDPPSEELPLIDVPAFTQSEDAPDSLLLQLDESDLTERSKERLRSYSEQSLLSYSTLRQNVGVDPSVQLNIAQEIVSDLTAYNRKLNWSGFPTWNQLFSVCSLMWDNFNCIGLGAGSARSVEQLTTRINNLRSTPSIASMIQQQMLYDKDADRSVQAILDFLRLWAQFHFPRLLRTIDTIQKDIFSRNELPNGDYEAFATCVEHLFLDPTLVALDEYGIPIQLARKLAPRLQPNGDLDQVLARLKGLAPTNLNVSAFEADLLADAQRYLP